MNLLQNPNKRRWYIVATIFVAIICNYLDRQLLSILKPEILTHFGIEDLQYAWIVNVFLICYAIMYPISGILVDRFGSKKVMLGGIVAWSLACIGGGLSTNVVEFTICRGILGLAEPTIFAGQIVAVTLWFEKRHRATANSLCTAGGSLGTVIAPLVIAWMARFLPWHDVFIVAGLVGLVIAVAWALIYKNPPQEVLAVTMAPDKDEVARNNGEQQRAFTWGELWTTRSLWGVLLIRLISDPVWYFCCFWLPGYLRSMGEAQGLSQQATLDMIQYIGGLPFLFGAVGGILTSVWSDWLVRRGMPALKARKTMMIIMAFVAPLCILTPYVSEWQAVSFDARIGLVVAIFSLIAIMCLSWLYTICVVIAEAFPVKNVASVVGITAGAGAVGGAVFNEDIIKYARRKFDLIIGEQTAEAAKCAVGCAFPLKDIEKYELRGRDERNGLPAKVEVTSDEIGEAMLESVVKVVHKIQSVLEETPPELTADIGNAGIVLTGGGAKLRGLDTLISKQTKMRVRIAEEPEDCVILGAGRAVQWIDSVKMDAGKENGNVPLTAYY